jgi:signal peptide peptidase SppA
MGLDVRVDETTMSMGKIQAIRDRIRAFNRTHKFSVAYLEFATDRSYYLTPACQTLFVLSKSEFHLHGMMAFTTFMRGTFDKLGIYPDYLHIGEYKTATNVYTEKKFTDAHREKMKGLLDDWFPIFAERDGVAFSSEVIRHELELTKAVKPVVACMSGVAASGGYWLFMPANRIIAEPGTITGSIGVLMGKFNIRGLYEKLGLSMDFVATTENSTLEYPFRNFTPLQREIILKNMRGTYNDFLQGVVKVEDVDKIAQGCVWTGERARQLGPVDEIGGLHTAIARELAEIPAGEKVRLLRLPPHRSLFDRLLNFSDDDGVSAPVPSLPSWLGRLESLGNYSVWTILPGVPQVQ